MRLSDYPRPPFDNGRGLHWSPKQQNHGIHDWERWERELLNMGIKWVKVITAPDENGLRIFRRLVANEIMPIARYVAHLPSVIEASMLEHARRLRNDLGVPYIERVNEPDADVEWEGYGRPSDWHIQTAQINIEDARRIHDVGCIPVIAMYNAPPPKNCIQLMLDVPGGREILERGCVLSIHNYGKGRPLEYPNDRVHMFGDQLSEEDYYTVGLPPVHWSQADIRQYTWKGLSRDQVNRNRRETANPHDTIMSNITNFRMFEYWHALWVAEGLPEVPIIGTEAGWEVDDKLDDKYPEPTADMHKHYLLQQARFQDGSIPLTLYNPDGSHRLFYCPGYYFTSANWLVAEAQMGEAGQWEQGAWFTDWHNQKYKLQGRLPITEALGQTYSRVRASGPVPAQWSSWAKYNADWWGISDCDDRINYIFPHIEIEQPQGEGWYIRQLSLQYYDDQDKQYTDGYIFLKAFRAGSQVSDVSFVVTHGDSSVVVNPKDPPEYADLFLTAPRPTYQVKMQAENTAIVKNIGLGTENQASYDHASWVIEFEWRTGRSQEASMWYQDKNRLGLEAHQAEGPVPNEARDYWERCKASYPDFDQPYPTIVKANVSIGEEYWKVIYVGTLPGSVNHEQHYVFIDAIGEHENRLMGTRGRWGWAGMSDAEYASVTPFVVDKPDGEFGANVAMTAYGQMVQVTTERDPHPFGDGLKADRVINLHHSYPKIEEGNHAGHTSHYVVYHKTVADDGGTEPPETYTITVTANPQEGGTVTGDGQYDAGIPVTVGAAPNVDFIFQGWYENGVQVSTQANYTFTPISNRSLVASFVQVPEGPTSPYKLILYHEGKPVASLTLDSIDDDSG